MPEHDLDPPKFARRALERLLQDWPAVKATLLAEDKEKEPKPSSQDDCQHLEEQCGTTLLDKFTQCLLVKCHMEMLDALLTTLIREMYNDSEYRFCCASK